MLLIKKIIPKPIKNLISNFFVSVLLIAHRNPKYIKATYNSNINELLGVIEILNRRVSNLEVALEEKKLGLKKLKNRNLNTKK
jgi:hypothetical protein